MKKHSSSTEKLIHVRLLPTGLLAMPPLTMHRCNFSGSLKLALRTTTGIMDISDDCPSSRYQLEHHAIPA